MKTNVQVVVDDATYNLSQGLRSFLHEAKLAIADGFQPGKDIPALVQAALADLFPLLTSLDAVKASAKENPQAFRLALILSIDDMVEDFLK